MRRHTAALLRTRPLVPSSHFSSPSLNPTNGTPGTRRARRVSRSPTRGDNSSQLPSPGRDRRRASPSRSTPQQQSPPPPLPLPPRTTSTAPPGESATHSRHLAFSKALGGALARAARRTVQGFVREARATELVLARQRVGERQGERDVRRLMLKVALLREFALRKRLAGEERTAVGRAVEAGEVAALGVLVGERERRREG